MVKKETTDLSPANGFKDRQRKWKMALISLGLLTMGFGVVALSPALVSIYSVFSGAIIGLNMAYGGANVATKWVSNKNNGAV